MGYSRRGHKGRVDLNHMGVVFVLRAAGYSVRSVASVGEGFPDLCVGVAGHNLLLEIKQEKGKLTKDEMDFAETWRGQVVTVRLPCEALDYVTGFKEGLRNGIDISK